MAHKPEIDRLNRWRHFGDGPATYTAGSKQFGDDVIVALIEIERLTAALADLRERSVEEGIHHFVNRIDAALEPKPDLRTLLPELAVIRQVMQERKPKPD